jgi:hypothetical protein
VSPRPYVRWHAFALAFLIASAGLLDAAGLAVGVGAASMLWLLSMHLKYLRDVRATTSWVPEHREKLDRDVSFVPLLTIVPATLFAALVLFGRLDPIEGKDAIRGIAIALAPTAAVVWGSSLVDWYLILPRISGQLGPRPCRAAEEEEWFPFPWTWKEVTRWWYIHRAVAALAFHLGSSAAIAAAVVSLTGFELLGHAVAGFVMLMFGAYALLAVLRGSTLAKEVAQAGHAKGIVGQTVTVERRAGQRHPLQFWRKLPALEMDGRRRLVIDVALESIQLADVRPRESARPSTPLRFEKNFDSVRLADVDAIRQANSKFSGCSDRCSGINWYCIENPRCFDPK